MSEQTIAPAPLPASPAPLPAQASAQQPMTPPAPQPASPAPQPAPPPASPAPQATPPPALTLPGTPPALPSMLELCQVSVRFGDLTIVDDVSVTVDEGQWFMIVGPNGAGKSTLISAITGGCEYTGSITCLNRSVKAYRPAELARVVGVLSQHQFVGYSFTVEEIVRLGRYSHTRGFLKGTSDEDEAAIERALELTGLKSFKKQSALTLSGGELQRTFLAQLFAQDPQILILDEPTNHLDLVYQKQVFALIQEWLKEPGRAVISVVHDLSLARAYGTHALLLHKGQAQAQGRCQKTLSSENLSAAYDMDVYAWMRGMLAQWLEGSGEADERRFVS